jgi:AcrR family transcriptional regulator
MAAQHSETRQSLLSKRARGSHRSGKERLIQATQVLLAEQSFDEITVEEIIKQADLSRQTFYYHFAGGKEELREELVARGTLAEAETQDVRAAILDAALRAFARSGISATPLDEIAEAAGVTRGTLCWHFHSKEELLSALVKHYCPHSILRPAIEQIMQEIEQGTLQDDEAILRRIAEAFYDGFTASAQSDLTRLSILLIYTHPEAARLLTDMILQGRKKISGYVQQRQEEGHFNSAIDAGLVVQVIAAFFAMRAISRDLRDSLPFAQLSREDSIDQLVSLLLYGLVRREPGPPGV